MGGSTEGNNLWLEEMEEFMENLLFNVNKKKMKKIYRISSVTSHKYNNSHHLTSAYSERSTVLSALQTT